MKMSMAVEGNAAKALQQFAAAFREEALRPTARAGALEFYDEMRRRAPVDSGTLRDAIYHAYADKESTDTLKVYRVSVNKSKAPHWYLVEYGHLQRYVAYQGNDGKVRLAVRPGMEGQARPTRRSPQEVKDAYWIPLPGGPKQVPAKPYIRTSWDTQQGTAMAAMRERLREKLAEILGGQPGGIDVD